MSSFHRVAARDGRTILVRPLEPDDKPLVVRGLERMSEQSRYRRFLSPKSEFTASELAYLTEVDHHDHEALIAIDPGSGESIGVARYVRLADEPAVAEPAVAVVDEWQHLGVGTILLRSLMDRAREEGLTHFRATVLRENRPMFGLLEKSDLGDLRTVVSSGPGVEVEFELAPETVWRQLLGALRAAARRELTFRLPRPRGH